MRPNRSKHIPQESPVMGFIGVTPFPLDVVPYAAVDVAVKGDSFLPISLAVFLTAVLIVLGDLQHSRCEVAVLQP